MRKSLIETGKPSSRAEWNLPGRSSYTRRGGEIRSEEPQGPRRQLGGSLRSVDSFLRLFFYRIFCDCLRSAGGVLTQVVVDCACALDLVGVEGKLHGGRSIWGRSVGNFNSEVLGGPRSPPPRSARVGGRSIDRGPRSARAAADGAGRPPRGARTDHETFRGFDLPRGAGF